jgi:hypothetical protein
VTGGVSAAMPRGGAASGGGGVEASPPTESASQDSAGARQSIRESGRENERRVNQPWTSPSRVGKEGPQGEREGLHVAGEGATVI